MAGRPLWTCPRCGRSFANENQSHSCLDLSEAQHLVGKSALSIAIYEVILKALEGCGQFRIHPQKTRIAFITRMTFGGVSLAERWVDLSLISPTVIDHPRIRNLFLYGPTSWGHSIRLSHPDQVDDQIGAWLCLALRRGDQETLDPNAEVLPVTGRSLELFRTAFRATVEDGDSNLVVRLPGHVGGALGLVDRVRARTRGLEYPAVLERRAGATLIPVDPVIGLAAGEVVDIHLQVDPGRN